MIDDFVPIIHRLEGRPIKLYAVGDVHIGARECDIEGFRKFIEKVSLEPDSYIVIVGDVLNNGIRDSLTNVYEETMPPSAQVDTAVELLEPVKDRILCGVGGNHELRSTKAVDLDPLYEVFTMLRIADRYRQSFCFMRIILRKNKTLNHFAFYLTHGKSAAKQRKFAQSAIEGVDAIIQGHTHNGLLEREARLVFSQKNLIKLKPIISLTACSWLRYGGYAARGQYLPQASAADGPQALYLDFTSTNSRQGKIQVVW